jgi:hypothetical protein
MSSKSKVYTKQSGIPSYGQGLFAGVDIKKGFIIDEYKGKVKSPGAKITSNRSNIQFADGFVLECSTNNLASFANDGINFPTETRQLMATLKSNKPFYEKTFWNKY